jgi:UDP-2,4-diacetamido-2,4,6-trideoxy-beta-L-altropyranose hydrolase
MMRVAFRVDASEKIGTGHFVRCLALADMLKQKGLGTRFVCGSLPAHFCEILEERGHELALLNVPTESHERESLGYAGWLGVSPSQDAEETLGHLADKTWDWLVVDHYALDARWETRLRQAIPNILVIDDLANREHDCDILLDQNRLADGYSAYSKLVPAGCRLLLGPRYALLRDAFKAWHDTVAPRCGDAKRIFVFFGGVDALGLTGHAIEALAEIWRPGGDVDVVLGSQNPRLEQIRAQCRQHSFNCHVDAANIAELMAISDMAVGAGGINVWERCCVGLPAVVVCTAENQKDQLDGAARAGLICFPDTGNPLAVSMREHVKALMENRHLRHYLSVKGMQLVDGLGVDRVAAAMMGAVVEVRRATPGDKEKLLLWRNHPDIRKSSRNPQKISWEEHSRWFDSVLTASGRVLLIGAYAGSDMGVVRFDIEADTAEVSIYLSPEWMGAKLGHALLASAERWLQRHMPDVTKIRAVVLEENERSGNLFLKSGYRVESMSLTKELH